MTAVEWFFEQIMYADVDIKVWREIFEQAKEMEQTNTDNKAIHFAEWLTKKHTLTLITLYEQFEDEQYGDK